MTRPSTNEYGTRDGLDHALMTHWDIFSTVAIELHNPPGPFHPAGVHEAYDRANAMLETARPLYAEARSVIAEIGAADKSYQQAYAAFVTDGGTEPEVPDRSALRDAAADAVSRFVGAVKAAWVVQHSYTDLRDSEETQRAILNKAAPEVGESWRATREAFAGFTAAYQAWSDTRDVAYGAAVAMGKRAQHPANGYIDATASQAVTSLTSWETLLRTEHPDYTGAWLLEEGGDSE